MPKKDYYTIEKNINKIIRGECTNFLDPNTTKQVCQKLKKCNYKLYYPYKNSEKVIIYTNKIPKIKLLEILSYDKLTHREILGSLFGLNIDSELFGDIIITNNHYYILVVESILKLIIKEYTKIGHHSIKTKEVPLSTLNNYIRQYEEISLIVSSLRIDNVISRLIGISRENIKEMFNSNEIMLNYEICHKLNYNLSNNDIFSIRGYGKYKFEGITKNSKKGKHIIKCYKYIDK